MTIYNFEKKEEKESFLKDIISLREDSRHKDFFINLNNYLSYNIDEYSSLSRVDVNQNRDNVITQVTLSKGRVMGFQSIKNFINSNIEEKDGRSIIKQPGKSDG